MIAIFALHERPSRRSVEQARDCGVTATLTCPISPKTLGDKLEAALSSPRPFVAAPDFLGPDRRTPRSGFGGKDRRVRMPRRITADGQGSKERY
jgi:hypothetical protein